MSHIGFYLRYSSYVFFLPHRAVFALNFFVCINPCTTVNLVEIYGYMLLCTPVLSVETSVQALTRSSMHVASVHALTRSSVNVLLPESFLVLPRVCVSINILLQASVHVTPQASVLAVAVPRVYLSFCTTYSCKVTLAMALGQIMSTSGVLLVIPCIIARNWLNVAPCNGVVNKSA